MDGFVDKIDKINKVSSIKSHFVKWYDVNYVPQPSENEIKKEPSFKGESIPNNNAEALPDTNKLSAEEASLLSAVLGQHDNTNAFEKAKLAVDEQERVEKQRLEDEANEIYMRLMREAEEDEAKKMAEINEAYASQS